MNPENKILNSITNCWKSCPLDDKRSSLVLSNNMDCLSMPAMENANSEIPKEVLKYCNFRDISSIYQIWYEYKFLYADPMKSSYKYISQKTKIPDYICLYYILKFEYDKDFYINLVYENID